MDEKIDRLVACSRILPSEELGAVFRRMSNGMGDDEVGSFILSMILRFEEVKKVIDIS